MHHRAGFLGKASHLLCADQCIALIEWMIQKLLKDYSASPSSSTSDEDLHVQVSDVEQCEEV